jgi:hypothetical protein
LRGAIGGRCVRRPWRELAGLAAVGLVVSSFASPAAAQVWDDLEYRNLEFRGIGVEAARVWASRVEPTTGYGAFLDLGLITPRVRIAPAARFWASSLNASEVDRLSQQIILVCERQVDATCPATLDLGEVRFSDLELAADAHYLFRPDRAISPYAGGGFSLHLLNGQGDFIDGTFVEDLLDSVAPGLAALIGVNIHFVKAFRLGGEARFMLASDVRYASLNVRGVWTLPAPRDSRMVR